jgi:hypothetical protein
VLQYSPDAVVLTLVNNDAELPNFVRIKPQVWSLRKCFIVDALQNRLMGRLVGDTARVAAGGIAETGSRTSGFYEKDVPGEYHFLLGFDNMLKALNGMHETLREHQIPAICTMYYQMLDVLLAAPPAAIHSNYNSAWFQAARSAGFVPCDPLGGFVEYLRTHGKTETAFWVKPEDFHPNAIAHAIMARELCRTLVAQKILPDSGAWAAQNAQSEANWEALVKRAALAP